MSTTTTRTAPARGELSSDPDRRVRTARMTGVFYLMLAITGLLGFLIIRPMLFDHDSAANTLENLLADPGLARIGIALELGIVLSQSLAAVWFFRLFRPVDTVAAASIAAFGLINGVAIMGSAAAMATALDVALTPGSAPSDVQTLYLLSEHLWGVGALFFGLWLIPMGWCALRSGWMPRMLGRLLIVGGGGYVVSAFVVYLFADPGLVANLLTVPASIGEFWMIGYLLVRGVRR